LKLACWFLRRRFLKVFSEFLLFRYYLPLGKGVVLHLYNSESPLPNDALCQVWLNWPSGSEEEVENVKLMFNRQTDRQTDGQTDDGQPEKLT
jgi:hypothetical protein